MANNTNATRHAGDNKSGAPGLAQRLYDVRQAGIFLGVSPWTVRELVWRGELSAIRVGRLIRLDLRDLESFIARNRQNSPA